MLAGETRKLDAANGEVAQPLKNKVVLGGWVLHEALRHAVALGGNDEQLARRIVVGVGAGLCEKDGRVAHKGLAVLNV